MTRQIKRMLDIKGARLLLNDLQVQTKRLENIISLMDSESIDSIVVENAVIALKGIEGVSKLIGSMNNSVVEQISGDDGMRYFQNRPHKSFKVKGVN